MTLTACPRAPRGKKNNKLFMTAKKSKKRNITTYEYTKCILFRFET